MASIKYIGETKKGKCFEISVSRGYGKSPYTRRWYPEKGWSQKYIDRELTKIAAEFEKQCRDGLIKTRQELKDEASKAALKEKKDFTVQSYAETVYMIALETTASENTLAANRQMLKARINPRIGSEKLKEISPATIEMFLLGIQREGLSAGTAIKYYAFLHAMFERAYKHEIIEKNPMDKVDKPKKTKNEITEDTVEAFSIEDVQKILQALSEEPLKWKAAISLMLDTGVRRGECMGLTWDCVDFNNSKITISKTLNYTSNKGVFVSTPKNGKQREVDVSAEVLEMLRLIKEIQNRTVKSDYVFTQENSEKPIHPQSINRYLKKFEKRAGVGHINPHKFRHSWATIALANGADIKTVSARLGHSDAGFTLRQYTHVDMDAYKVAGDVFRNAIATNGNKEQ